MLSRVTCSLRRRLLSTNSSVTVPTNLSLADPSALLAPPSSSRPSLGRKVVVAGSSHSMEHLFPPLNVPETLRVRVFEKPGAFVAESEFVAVNRLVLGAAIRRDIVHEVIRYQRHKLRQPKKTKRIGEIAGSTKKPRPQKGTGAAQVGNRRNSVWRGGQKAHGPVIRDYSISMNRKMRAMGMMIALSAKFREGNLLVFDSLTCPTGKTKDLVSLMEQHGVADSASSNSLIVDLEFQESFALACRNIAHATLLPQTKANVLDIVKRQKLVLSADAFVALQQRILDQYNYQGRRKHLFVQSTLLQAGSAENSADEKQ